MGRMNRRPVWVGAAALLLFGIVLVARGPQADPPRTPSVSNIPVPPPPSPDGIPLASPHAAAVTVPSAPGAWGGPRTGQEATLSERVVNYEIQATLDPVKHTIDGHERLTWRNRSDREVKAVYLHLYLNAFESAGSTFFTEEREKGFRFRSAVAMKDGQWGHMELKKVQQDGAAVPWHFVHPDHGPETDHTVVRLDLPAAVPAGGSTKLDIDFHDQLPRVVARTGYFGSFHLVGQWFPKIGVLELPGERGALEPRWNVHEFHLHSEFYADYGNFDVKLTVPQGYVVGATGEEQGEPIVGQGQVTHHFIQGDVHDFAWTADNRTAKPLEETYRAPGSPTVKVRVLFPPEYQACAAPALQATLDSLRYFSESLGPYPYRTVTVVIPPFHADEAGGMEYPTFYTGVGFAKVEPDTLAALTLESTVIHEFGHGYFYGLLGSNEFEEPFLDEGLNTYWDARMIRERGQVDHPTTSFLRSIGIVPAIKPFDNERLGAHLQEPADPVGANSWDRYSSGSYAAVYARSATVMRDLEQRLGKAVLEKAFKAYYAQWKFRHPSTADLRETLAEVSGQREAVESAFAQQVYSTRKVDDRIVSLTSVEQLPQPGSSTVDGKWVERSEESVRMQIRDQRQAWQKAHPKGLDRGPFPFLTTLSLRRNGAAVPQTVRVTFADGSVETVAWQEDRRWARFTWVKPASAVSAELDPLRNHFLDANKLDDSRTIKPNGGASRRWTSEVAAFLQTLYSLVVTL